MALGLKGWVVRVTVADQGGKAGTLTYYIDPTALGGGTEYTDAAAIRTTILAELDPVTDCAIVGHSLTEEYVEDTNFYGTGELEEKAAVTMKLETAGKSVTVYIPAPSDSIFKAAAGPDFDVVDAADADLQAYLAVYQSDIMLSDGEHVQTVSVAGNVYGHRQHKSSKRG
jgi:hypothetical protein